MISETYGCIFMYSRHMVKKSHEGTEHHVTILLHMFPDFQKMPAVASFCFQVVADASKVDKMIVPAARRVPLGVARAVQLSARPSSKYCATRCLSTASRPIHRANAPAVQAWRQQKRYQASVAAEM